MGGEILGMPGWIAVVTAGLLGIVFVNLITYASRYTKVGPNEVLVVAGGRTMIRGKKGRMESIGFRIVKGGGTFVWPVFERASRMSLEIIATDFSVTAGKKSASGTLQFKISGDPESLRIAAENLLSKSPDQVAAIGREIVENSLRGILEESDAPGRGVLEDKVRDAASMELPRIGLEVVSFSVKELRDA